MNKIKLRVVLLERSLVVQLLEQDKRSRKSFNYKASNGFSIWSSSHPEIRDDSFFIRGERLDFDLCIMSKYFDSNEKRDEYISRIYFALKEWSERWEGWDEKNNPCKTDTISPDQMWEF